MQPQQRPQARKEEVPLARARRALRGLLRGGAAAELRGLAEGGGSGGGGRALLLGGLLGLLLLAVVLFFFFCLARWCFSLSIF